MRPAAKVARYRRERTPKERESSAQMWSVRHPLESSFLPGTSSFEIRSLHSVKICTLVPFLILIYRFP